MLSLLMPGFWLLEAVKMRNKRGQIFSLFMVFIALAMSMLVIGMYFVQQKNVAASLVSPLSVLEIRDDLEVFEMAERELILSSLEGVEAEFGSEDFAQEFRVNFISGLSGEMKSFLLKDLSLSGEKIKDNFDKDTFFNNVVYPGAYMENGKMRFVRGKIGKKDLLSSGGHGIVNFPVDFNYEFFAEYLVVRNNGKFEVERV